MRLAPVALRHFRNPAMLRDVAARQSRTTHAAPEAVDACVGAVRLMRTSLRLPNPTRVSGGKKAAPLGESGGTGLFVVVAI
jgi:hypothetical protein